MTRTFIISTFILLTTLGFGQCEFSIHPEEANGCQWAYEDVVWTNISGVQVSGNQVSQTGGGAWQAGCSSTGSVYSEGFAFTVVNQTNARRAFGLSATDAGPDFNSIQYAVYLRNNGTINIYESGNNRGNYGEYSIGDTIFIKAKNGRIEYYKNQEILRIGNTAPNLPLSVDCSFRDNGAEISNVQIVNPTDLNFVAIHPNPVPSPSYEWFVNDIAVGSNQPSYSSSSLTPGDVITCVITAADGSCFPDPQSSNQIVLGGRAELAESDFYVLSESSQSGCVSTLEKAIWNPESLIRTHYNGTILKKTQGNGNWNAGASSLNTVEENGSVFTLATETNRRRMIGLSTDDPDANYTSIDHAIYLRNNGSISIYESGTNRGNFGTYSTGDTIRLTVESGKVKYYRNSQLLRISTPSSLPLLVDVSIRDNDATIGDIFIENKSQGNFEAVTNNLGSSSFEWYVNEVPQLNDSPIFEFPSIEDSDIITCQIFPSLNGCSSGSYLSAEISAHLNETARELNFYVSGTPSESACSRSLENVKWDVFSAVNVEGTGNSATKIQGNGNWNAGISSLNSVSDNGYFEFTAAETNRRRMIGLSNADNNVNFNSIDFAVYLRNNGTISIYESGTNRGNFGSYNTGDLFRISLEQGSVRYYQNGELLRIASSVPQLPLVADLSFRDDGATATNLVISNYTTGEFTAFAENAGPNPVFNWYVNDELVFTDSNSFTDELLNDGDIVHCELLPDLEGCSSATYISNQITLEEEPAPQAINFFISGDPSTDACSFAEEEVSWNFVETVNLEIQGSNLEKIQNNGDWNAGSSSLNSIAMEGYLRFTALETNRRRMIGLNNEDQNVGFADIDYAVYLRSNGTFQIYESGNNLGNFGNYNSGDVFEIRVFNSEVRYFQNNEILYISNKVPDLPLFVDVSVRDVGATVTGARLFKYNSGAFTAFATDAGSNPTFQWILNGEHVGTNSSNYSNPNLLGGDIISCELMPDLGGCSEVTYTSNTIALNYHEELAPIEFFIETSGTLSGDYEAAESVQWVTASLQNLEADESNLEKIQSNGQWNGNAFSNNSLNGNGYFEFVVPNPNSRFAAGLSNSDQNSSFTSIDYCFRQEANGNIRVNENGANRGTFGAVNPGDTLRIIAESSTIRYWRNQTLLYTSSIAPSFPLYADVSMRDVGSVIQDAAIINQSTGIFIAQIPGGEPVDYQWFINGQAVGQNSPTFSNTTLIDEDIISCEISPQFDGCSGASFESNTIRIIGPEAVTQWLGGLSIDWHNPGNWSIGVPDLDTDVRINSGTNFEPVITSPASCRNIIIQNGSNLTISESALIISGDLTNNSTIVSNSGTITFFGSENSTVNGMPFEIDRLVLNKLNPSDTVYFNTDLEIATEMVFISGLGYSELNEIIFLNGSDSRDGSSASYIDGVVRKIGNESFIFPVGSNGIYAPLTLAIFGSEANEFTARYFQANPNDEGFDILSYENGLTNVSSCEYWIINHEVGSDEAGITLSYEDARSCGTPEPWNLNVVRWNGELWENLGSSGFEGDTQSGIIKSLDAISEFSPFTLGSSSLNNPLPVELLNFDVTSHNSQIKIEWSTATETNSDYFEVERSSDLMEFSSIGIVDGAGNSATPLHYELFDDSFLSGTWYYRLKQFDIDGQFEIYPPKSVTISGGQSLTLFPNPAFDHVNINQSGFGDRVEIKIYTSTGVLLRSLESDLSEFELSIEDLNAGSYVLEVSGSTGLLREQLIKK